MFNPLKQVGDLKKMRDQAITIQKDLEKEEIIIDKRGVRVVITGAQRISAIEVNSQPDDHVRDAVNEAIKKSQEVAAKKLSSMTGGLGGLGSLLGGK